MSYGYENGPSGPSAPLLTPEPATTDESNNHANNDSVSKKLESTDSGGWFIWALTFSAGISGLLFGYDTGVISSTLVSIQSDLSNRALTTLDKSLITSCTSLFALIASPLAGVMADKLGRRSVILVADVLFTVGSLIQAVTSEVWGMTLGRSIVGLAVGGASLVTPLYISELAPSHVRGRLVTILCLFITGGQVIAYIVGWLFSSVGGGWRWIVGLGILPAVLQFSIVVALPETPRWLVQAGLESRATYVLAKVYGGRNSDSDRVARLVLRDIQQEVAKEDALIGNDRDSGWWHVALQRARDLLYTGGNRRALTIAVMLQGLQQLSGFNSLMYFSATIFSILSFSSPTLTSLSVAVANFLFTLLAFVYIDKIGRRRILLYSIPVMVIALIVCALAFSSMELPALSPDPQPQEKSDGALPDSPLLPVTILLCLTVYTASYAFGLGNVPWQQSELFPLNVRSLGSSLATATNWGSNFIVGLSFLPMMEWLSPGWTFAAYAVVCTIGWVGVWAIYPEMSGLGLEEVKGLLADGWGVRESLTRVRDDDDMDIVNLSLSCSFLHNAIMPAESLIWRRLFKDTYDIPRQRSSTELKIEYQTRSIVLAQKISFKCGEGEEQTLWLEVLRDMLLESFESKNPSTSKNIKRIRSAHSTTEFLDRPLNGYSQHKPGPPSELLCAVQLCLTGMALDQSMFCRCLRTDYDIGAVYSYDVDTPRTLVDSKEIDFVKLLHIRNFWLRHLLNTDEATYSDSYRMFPEPRRPRILRVKPDPDSMNWPRIFQNVIPLLGEDSTRSYFRGYQSSSVDESVNLVRGFVEAVKSPQGGFPGWRRVCFALYETHTGQIDPQGEDYMEVFVNKSRLFPREPWPPFDLETDFLWIHGYEGLVLPGGQIMVGQWVDMVDTRARGPFIFWATKTFREQSFFPFPFDDL
ncbi:putative MFS myo-inositol transporter [Aspergillus candidus]|uniref:And other transporter-domain-containing protein n=1 Tax=Aspergillus candidus TaxID=41067 RepID=A0A2I2F067_ASPCN|nr:and other transporter-domain-containing protein [Aspergillus candidus]PLB34012.1 and other transporter-domain-containing protein [Aspergillus candidus]